MSFDINKQTFAIEMHRGDTGAKYLQARRTSGKAFEEGDVAIFEVKRGNQVYMYREYPLDDDDGAGNGRFLLAFVNSDTDTWPAGTYQTEIRVSLNPIRHSGAVVDGTTVRTPKKMKSTLQILDTLIDI